MKRIIKKIHNLHEEITARIDTTCSPRECSYLADFARKLKGIERDLERKDPERVKPLRKVSDWRAAVFPEMKKLPR